MAPFGAVLLAILAAWCSQGTIGFSPTSGRIGVLPVSAEAVLLALGAGAAVAALRRGGASLAPIPLLAFVLLPWLPVPVPAAFLLWVQPLALVVWVGVAILMIASLRGVAAPGAVVARHPRVVAASLAILLSGAAAWRVAPMIPGGDEPHYLVITQSLILDHDLTIEDVHRRGDYRAYYAGELPPHVQRRGKNGAIYSVHAPGLPALVAPAFAVGGYPAVVCFLVVLAGAGSALAWHVAWLATRRPDAAWFAWAAVTLPATAIFQSFTVYPDGPGGIVALTGVWALLRAGNEAESGATRTRPWLLHGAALATLPWMHSRFAVIAGGLGALVLLRLGPTRNPLAKAVAFLAVPAVSAVLWIGFFVAVYGTPDPSAPYGPGEIGSFLFVPGGLGGLLFDQRFGLLTYAPVLAVAFAGVGVMLAAARWRRLAIELLFVVVPYLVTVTHFAMWWGGWSPPARFFAAVLPLFAIPAAAAWTVSGRAGHAAASVALGLTAFASAILVIVDRGRLAFNTRETSSLWLQWFGRAADLTTAAPMWARDTAAPLFRAATVWVLIAAAAFVLLRRVARLPAFSGRIPLGSAAAAMAGVVVMAASTAVWAMQGVDGRAVAASQLELLDAVASARRAVGVRLFPPAAVEASRVPAQVRIEMRRRELRRPPGRETPPLFTLPPLPAGTYRVTADAPDPRGWLMIGAVRDARDPFAIRTIELPFAPVILTFPLPVRALTIRGDEDAARSVTRLIVEPLSVFAPAERLTSEPARRAARYDGYTAYFLDDRSFPEPEAFWIGGDRQSRVALQPDRPRTAAAIRLRNAPVDNVVTIAIGAWRHERRMAPGEEQVIEVPLDPRRGGAVLDVTTSAGFRPAEHDPDSRDQRFLGVWIKVGG